MMATQNTTSTESASAPKPQAPQAKAKKPFPRPRPHFKNREFAEPAKQSTTSTPLTNDPLWMDSLVREGDHGMIPAKAIEEAPADAVGFVDLVEREYDALVACDRYFAKAVPLSAYAYYHHVVWWYKIALLAAKHGKASHDQLNLIQFVEGYDAVVGAGAAAYIAGFGDFTDVNGVKHYIGASEPNGHGHFGNIDQHTHGRYETSIAPLVSFSAVLADIEATRQHRDAHDWWLDEIFKPTNKLMLPTTVIKLILI